MFHRLAAHLHRPHPRAATLYGMPLATPRDRTLAAIAAMGDEATFHYRAAIRLKREP
jgi:hypothetical protein